MNMSWFTQRNVGPITVQFQASPEKAKECVQAIRAELARMKEPGYFTDEELRNAAHRAEVEQVQNREQPSELAHTLTFWWASASLDYYTGYVENLRKVGPADIARYLDRWILGKPFVLGAMMSPETEKAGLDQASLEALVGAKPWPAGKGPSTPSKEVSP